MENMYQGRPVKILLVEDNPGDVRLTQEVLKEGSVHNEMYVARDGLEAISFLQRQGKNQNAERPDVILLDLNLPGINGREVLAAIKEDAQLKRIPVIILTTSDDEQDIFKSYDLHANAYVTKPVDLDKFIDIVKQIEGFWLSVVRLPGEMDA